MKKRPNRTKIQAKRGIKQRDLRRKKEKYEEKRLAWRAALDKRDIERDKEKKKRHAEHMEACSRKFQTGKKKSLKEMGWK